MFEDFIGYKCDRCKGRFRKRHMIIGIIIGPHYPWDFCRRCYNEFFKITEEETK